MPSLRLQDHVTHHGALDITAHFAKIICDNSYFVA